jgi:hypothetical protein
MTPAGSSPEGRKASFVIGPTSDRTGVYYDQKGRPMNGSAQVLNPEFSERAVAETRALLARVPA